MTISAHFSEKFINKLTSVEMSKSGSQPLFLFSEKCAIADLKCISSTEAKSKVKVTERNGHLTDGGKMSIGGAMEGAGGDFLTTFYDKNALITFDSYIWINGEKAMS